MSSAESKAKCAMLERQQAVDEPDRIPEDITISMFDIVLYCVAIIGHFVDMAVDTNIAVRYYLAGRMVEFGWTVASILVPALINTAISIRMYHQDRQQQKSEQDQFTKHPPLRIFMLVILMAPVMRITDALIYALKSRRAAQKRDLASQRLNYRLMLKEDADAALLRIFECFLEAAPQQVLQLSLLLRRDNDFTAHQVLSISSSIIGMGWALASYQRSIRFASQDKINMNWVGSMLQIIWHFLVSLSRIVALAIAAYLFPAWLLLGVSLHILMMAAWLQLFDRSPFCGQSTLGSIAFSLAMGMVYVFTYVLPIEGRTRYRYSLYYTICFIENVACCVAWYVFADEVNRDVIVFYPVLVSSVVPFVLGMVFMVVYYRFVHPKVRKGAQHVEDIAIKYTANGRWPTVRPTVMD